MKLGRWERVGERMRQLVPATLLTGEMCRARWSHYVGPMAQGLKKGESWSKAEVYIACVNCFIRSTRGGVME